MADESKPNKKPKAQPKEDKKEKQAEIKTEPEVKNEDKSEEVKMEEQPIDKETPVEKIDEPVTDPPVDDKSNFEEKTVKEVEAKPDVEVVEQKISAKSDSNEKPKKDEKKKDHKDDFKYIVRIANTDIDGEKTIVHGLTSIKGIGMHMSVLIIDEAGIDKSAKFGNLSDADIEKIKSVLGEINKICPSWMLNRRNDYETGKDIHLIGSEIDLRLRDEINIMKKIRAYKGIRHESGLRVRGQRTRANNRSGLTLGVSKRKATQGQSGK